MTLFHTQWHLFSITLRILYHFLSRYHPISLYFRYFLYFATFLPLCHRFFFSISPAFSLSSFFISYLFFSPTFPPISLYVIAFLYSSTFLSPFFLFHTFSFFPMFPPISRYVMAFLYSSTFLHISLFYFIPFLFPTFPPISISVIDFLYSPPFLYTSLFYFIPFLFSPCFPLSSFLLFPTFSLYLPRFYPASPPFISFSLFLQTFFYRSFVYYIPFFFFSGASFLSPFISYSFVVPSFSQFRSLFILYPFFFSRVSSYFPLIHTFSLYLDLSLHLHLFIFCPLFVHFFHSSLYFISISPFHGLSLPSIFSPYLSYLFYTFTFLVISLFIILYPFFFYTFLLSFCLYHYSLCPPSLFLFLSHPLFLHTFFLFFNSFFFYFRPFLRLFPTVPHLLLFLLFISLSPPHYILRSLFELKDNGVPVCKTCFIELVCGQVWDLLGRLSTSVWSIVTTTDHSPVHAYRLLQTNITIRPSLNIQPENNPVSKGEVWVGEWKLCFWGLKEGGMR